MNGQKKVAEGTSAQLREVATRLFAKHGYDGISLRQVAEEVGIKPSSLYNHMESKQDLLVEILSNGMKELLASVGEKLDGVAGPIPRLKALIYAHLQHFASRPLEVLVGATEIRSLESKNQKAYIAMRDQYEDWLLAIIEEGVDQKVFRVVSAKLATLAIFDMLAGVSRWYKPKGRYTVTELQPIYLEMALHLLQADSKTIKAHLSNTTSPGQVPGRR